MLLDTLCHVCDDPLEDPEGVRCRHCGLDGLCRSCGRPAEHDCSYDASPPSGADDEPRRARRRRVVNPLDEASWEGPPAPEGSDVRREARARIYRMAKRQIRLLGRSEAEFVEGLVRSAPQLAGAVGLDEIRRIAKVAKSIG